MKTLWVALLAGCFCIGVLSMGEPPDKPPPPKPAAGSQTKTAELKPTNTFGIYLVTGEWDRRILGYGKGDWSRVTLSEQPIITGTDILSYDFENHSMTLRPEALARIPQPPVSGTPFVVVANGERVYIGAFVTGFSSMSFAVPAITVGHSFTTNQPANTLVIERGYPPQLPQRTQDRRNDPRIRSALQGVPREVSHPPLQR